MGAKQAKEKKGGAVPYNPLQNLDAMVREPVAWVLGHGLDDGDQKQQPVKKAAPPRKKHNLASSEQQKVLVQQNHAKLAAALGADVKTDTVWKSFFSQAFLVGGRAIHSGAVDIDDVLDEEPFLYFGLTGAVVLETITRSVDAPVGALVLAGGQQVDSRVASSCPPEHKPLFESMLKVKTALLESGLSHEPRRLSQLQRIVLYASSDKPPVHIDDENTRVALNRIASMVQSVATHISQMGEFLKQFGEVLHMLADSYQAPVEEEAVVEEEEPDHKAPQDAGTSAVAAVAAPVDGMDGGILTSVLNSAFEVAERLLQRGTIPSQDFVQQQPYLPAGLAGCTLLDALQRSVNSPHGIVLAVGRVVTLDTCPAEHKDLL